VTPVKVFAIRDAAHFCKPRPERRVSAPGNKNSIGAVFVSESGATLIAAKPKEFGINYKMVKHHERSLLRVCGDQKRKTK
jgi:hypothetical protein